ncbi:unnamed protein product [Polarella glacialis]|uniref:Pentatricopeptide repeat-containing protein, chloroplastic n=1 Tax=Polarella glacialis TaxID=89957 RepID=A0A813LAK3_POLGL|nr:unnamed protein product [Polarella glacialis]
MHGSTGRKILRGSAGTSLPGTRRGISRSLLEQGKGALLNRLRRLELQRSSQPNEGRVALQGSLDGRQEQVATLLRGVSSDGADLEEASSESHWHLHADSKAGVSCFWVRDLTRRLTRNGLASDIALTGEDGRSGNASSSQLGPLVRALGRCGHWQEVLALLELAEPASLAVGDGEERLVNTNLNSAAIVALGRSAQWQQAVSLLFSRLRARQGTWPTDSVSCFNAAISACERSSQWARSLALLVALRAVPLPPNTVTLNATITACSRGGRWDLGISLLNSMPEMLLAPDVISFNAALGACERGGKWQHCLQLLASMESSSGLRPDLRSFSSVASACAKGGDWARVLGLFAEMKAQLMSPDIFCHTALLSACQRSHSWQLGLEILHAGLATGAEEELQKVRPSNSQKLCLNLESVGDQGCIQSFKEIYGLWEAPRTELDRFCFEVGLGMCDSGGQWQLGLDLVSELQLRGFGNPSVPGLCSLFRAFRTPSLPLAPDGSQTIKHDKQDSLEIAACSSEHIHQHRLLGQIRDTALGLLLADGDDSVADGRARAARASVSQASLAASKAIYMVLAMDLLHHARHLDGMLETAFRLEICTPVVATLNQLACPTVFRTSLKALEVVDVGRPREIRQARILPDLAVQHGLGSYFTEEALVALDISAGRAADWVVEAQNATCAVLAHWFQDSAWLPSEAVGRELVVWVSYSVGPTSVEQPQAGMGLLRSRGEVVSHGRNPWQLGETLLPPVFSHHDRKQHAERRALLRVADRLLHFAAQLDEEKMASSAEHEGGRTDSWKRSDDLEASSRLAEGIGGTVRLYATHTPCVSCLAIFCQFKALFPQVRLSIAFSTWRDTRSMVALLLDEKKPKSRTVLDCSSAF